jgi:hypothetical protein
MKVQHGRFNFQIVGHHEVPDPLTASGGEPLARGLVRSGPHSAGDDFLVGHAVKLVGQGANSW